MKHLNETSMICQHCGESVRSEEEHTTCVFPGIPEFYCPPKIAAERGNELWQAFEELIAYSQVEISKAKAQSNHTRAAAFQWILDERIYQQQKNQAAIVRPE